MTGKGGENMECCMCGDYGLSQELFPCKACRFRSQHRYCSNLYPKSESYDICNWCLTQKVDSKEKSHSCPNTPSFYGSGVGDVIKGDDGDVKRQKTALPMEKTTSKRKRIMTRRELEGMISQRRAKSEEKSQRSNEKITVKHGFKNKVRRYKLLHEVSN